MSPNDPHSLLSSATCHVILQNCVCSLSFSSVHSAGGQAGTAAESCFAFQIMMGEKEFFLDERASGKQTRRLPL